MKKLLYFISVLVLSVQYHVLNANEKPTLAIFPFFIESAGVCPICKGVFRKGDVLPKADSILSRILYEKIEAKGIFKIFPPKKLNETLSKFDKKEIQIRPDSFYHNLGKELNIDFLLVGYLFRFEERIGSTIGVERPSSVGFDLHLIRLRDGIEVWRGKFDETQRPLSENLLKFGSFLRRRASWLTAEELAEVGMEEVLKSLEEKEIKEK